MCRFDYGWDQRLIDELEKLKECSPNPVISTYPPGIESVRCLAQKHLQNRLSLPPLPPPFPPAHGIENTRSPVQDCPHFPPQQLPCAPTEPSVGNATCQYGMPVMHALFFRSGSDT